MSNLQPKQFSSKSTGVAPHAYASGAVRDSGPEARTARASVAGKDMAGRLLQGMQKTQRQSFRD
jgi:hypothetical protein